MRFTGNLVLRGFESTLTKRRGERAFSRIPRDGCRGISMDGLVSKAETQRTGAAARGAESGAAGTGGTEHMPVRRLPPSFGHTDVGVCFECIFGVLVTVRSR